MTILTRFKYRFTEVVHIKKQGYCYPSKTLIIEMHHFSADLHPQNMFMYATRVSLTMPRALTMFYTSALYVPLPPLHFSSIFNELTSVVFIVNTSLFQ